MFTSVSNHNPAAQSSAAGAGGKQQLEQMHQQVKHYIDNNIKPDSSLGRLDFEAMPQLINWANKNYPGLSLHHAAHPFELAEKLHAMVQRGETSARFVGNYAADSKHMCAFEFRMSQGKPSLIGIEPASTNGTGPKMMAFRITMALQQHLPEAKFAMLEANQQSSEFDCALFSLDYAVKMHKSAAVFEQLHDQNMQGGLPGKDAYNIVPHSEVNKMLPPVFMKHMQSQRRLAEITSARPELASEPINKKNETLAQRIDRHAAIRETATDPQKKQNESILHQREKFVRKALGM